MAMYGALAHPHFRTVVQVLRVVGLSQNLRTLEDKFLNEEASLVSEERVRTNASKKTDPSYPAAPHISQEDGGLGVARNVVRASYKTF